MPPCGLSLGAGDCRKRHTHTARRLPNGDVEHGPSCRCPQCRARRVTPSHAAAPARDASPPRPQAVPLAPLAPIKPTVEEQAVIDEDPLAFILVMRESDVSVQQIRSKLLNSSQSPAEAEVEDLLAQADALYSADRRERGMRRIKKGIAFTVGGIVLTIPLALFGGIFVLGGIILTLAGVFQLGKGIYEVKG